MANYDNDPVTVQMLQHAINAAGYTPKLVEDGKYGPATHAGVLWYQHLHHITEDGIIGDEVIAATIAPGPGNPTPLVPPVSILPKKETPVATPPKVIPLNLHGMSQQKWAGLTAAIANTTPGLPGAPVVTPAFVVPQKKVHWPTWLGAVLGGIGGTLLGGPPIGSAIGLAIGGLGGAGVSHELNKPKAATVAVAPPPAAFAGEPSLFGCEDDLTVVAGDIGVPMRAHRIKG